jgi:rhodanese-related sulfurtransferase
MHVTSVLPQQLHERREAGTPIDLIDVRTPLEFREMHADGARNVPLDSLDPAKVMRAHDANGGQPVYFICRAGSRGQKACEKLMSQGYENVVNVDGGTLAWESAGFPVVRGKKAISLERQVRIAAGFLVLAGSLLAFFVHPYFVALPAFVGAGLIFAGITDSCAMGMLIAKMPWNQISGDEVSGDEASCDVSPADSETGQHTRAACCG